MAGPGSIVWLASYPKSGNTWLRAMLTALLYPQNHQLIDLNAMVGGSELGERQFLDDICAIDSSNLTHEQLKPYLRSMRLSAGTHYAAPYFAKTHNCFGRTADGLALFPAESARLAILVVRHPFDVAISLAAHNRTNIDTAIQCMADSGYMLNHQPHEGSEFLPVHIGDWSSHTESWLDQKELPLLLLRYEDMIEDTINVLRKVAESSGIPTESEKLVSAAAATSFERLKQAEQQFGFAEKPAGMPGFFRSGQAGGWQAILNSDQIMAIQERHATAMIRLGYTA
jgi:hypothetical protein